MCLLDRYRYWQRDSLTVNLFSNKHELRLLKTFMVDDIIFDFQVKSDTTETTDIDISETRKAHSVRQISLDVVASWCIWFWNHHRWHHVYDLFIIIEIACHYDMSNGWYSLSRRTIELQLPKRLCYSIGLQRIFEGTEMFLWHIS